MNRTKEYTFFWFCAFILDLLNMGATPTSSSLRLPNTTNIVLDCQYAPVLTIAVLNCQSSIYEIKRFHLCSSARRIENYVFYSFALRRKSKPPKAVVERVYSFSMRSQEYGGPSGLLSPPLYSDQKRAGQTQ